LGSWLLALWGAEAQALWAAAVAGVIVLAAMPWLADDAPVPTPMAGQSTKTTLLPRDAAVWVLGLLAMFSMVPEGAVLDWAALYLQQELGSDVARSGLAFAFFSAAMAVMRFAGDGVRNRFGAVATLRWSGLVAAAGLLGGALAPSDTVVIASFFVAGLGVANMVPILFSAAGNHPGLSPGAGIAAVTMLGYSGILVAPSTIGFVAEIVGFRLTYGVLAILLVLVSLLAGRTAGADGMRPVTSTGTQPSA
jgi:fucose permease